MSIKTNPEDPELDPNDPAVRAFIEAEAERAAAPYAGLFPEDVLAAFKERTALFLATHPDMVRLVRAAMRGQTRPAEHGSPANAKPAGGEPATEPRPARAQAGKRTRR